MSCSVMLVRCCVLSFVSEKPTRREWGTTYDFLSTITSIGIDFQKKNVRLKYHVILAGRMRLPQWVV